MIHGRTEQEVRRYDLFKGIITALLLLTLFFLVRNQPEVTDVAVPPAETEVAAAALVAPQLLSPAPGTEVQPGPVTFSGMGTPLSTAAMLVDGVPVAQTAVADDGSWQMQADLAPGQRSIELQTLDIGGNVAAAAPAFTLNVAEVPTAELPAAEDAAAVAPDAAPLRINAPAAGIASGIINLTGQGEPGFEVAIAIDGLDVGTTTVGEDGGWNVELPLAAGAYAITARQLTPDGVEAGAAEAVTLDVADLALPTVDLPATDVRTGAIILSGSGAPNWRVLIFAAGEAIGEAVVGEDGTWELPVDLPAGDYEIDVAAIGPDGTETERLPAISLPVLPAADQETVSGTVTYLQRVALPDDAVITVQLQDTSLADAPATVIGEQVIPTGGAQVPIDFAVPYDPADIEDGRRYTLSVRIEDGQGNLLFINDTAVPVVSDGNPTEGIEVITVPVEGAAAATGAEEATVSGTVTYLQRIALPDDAVVTVQIQDTSLADAPATVMGEQVIPTEGAQVPIDYAVSYDPAEIEENRTYTVRATITDGQDNLLFTSDTAIPVITRGNPTEDVEILTVPVEGAAAETGAEEATVSGTVTYAQRIALPEDAVLEVSLQDISTPGAAATELGLQVIPLEGAQVPIPFEVTYDPAQIVDNHTYAVRARILDGDGNLIWTSDTVTPVITNDNPTTDVEVEVVQVQTAVTPDVEFNGEPETAVEAVETAEAAQQPTFETLLSGLDAAGLTEVLSDAEASFTLFAPTDAAFDALPEEVIAAWNANPARYAEMMSYLVVEGSYPPEELADGQVLRTIAGTNVGITKEGDAVSINGVPTAGSVVAGNSVVYALNQVILAPLRPGITPPVIDEKGVPVFKGPLLTVVGLAEPGKRILLQVDGENFGEIATVDENEFWLVRQNIEPGVHTILAYMLEDDDTLMAISQLVTLPVP